MINKYINALFLVMLLVSGMTNADDNVIITAPENFISDFPNEQLSIQGLNQKVVHDDVFIPGNVGMDIVVTRRHSGQRFYFNSTILKVNRVLNLNKPVYNESCLGSYQYLGVSINGNSLNTVGFNNESIIPATTVAMFDNKSALICDGSVPILKLPDGRKYVFTEIKSESSPYFVATTFGVHIIEDRFGNTLTYNYEDEVSSASYNFSKRLKSIIRNDGQVVNFVYGPVINSKMGHPEEVVEINYSGKKVAYDYQDGRLESFTDAAGRKTSYTYSANSAPVGWQIQTITTPENLKIEYRYKVIGTPNEISGKFAAESQDPRVELAWKKITGPGIEERYFVYDTTFGPSGYAKTLIYQIDYKGALDLTTEYTFKTQRNNISSGQVVKIKRFEGEFYQGGTGYKTQYNDHKLVYEKSLTWVQRNTNEYGCSLASRIIPSSNGILNCGRYSILKQELKVRNGDLFDTYTTDVIEFDEYDEPKITLQSVAYNGSVSLKRYNKTEFQHDINNWIINNPTKSYRASTNSFGTPYTEIIYNSKLLPFQEKQFNQFIMTHSYHPDGNLLQTSYSGSNRYEKYENYYRGKARKITKPCSTTNMCNTANNSNINTVIKLLEVNSDGTTKSETDFNGNKVNYSYNPLGWLTKIDYADPKWADISTSYTVVDTTDDGINGSGIEIGSLRQTTTQGNYEKRVYFDGYNRPVYERERDVINSSTIRYKAINYDVFDNEIMNSFPSGNASSRIGMVSEYDGLGRVISQTRTSDGSSTQKEYLSGNKVAVTDGENNTRTTTYLAYGAPNYILPSKIETPDTDNVYITYSLYDKITRIIQGDVTETRIYDIDHQLCKLVRPETGVSSFGYNSQGQLIWRVEGTDGNGSTSFCFPSRVPESDKILLTYDNLGLLRTENFPDSTPDKTYSYDANSNLMSLSAGGVNWSYLYNSKNGLEKETLSLDGRNFVLDWEYNNLGILSSLKYPSGAVVDFAPNALGQATKAGSYATGVSYHPNGQIKQFTYGNGIVHNVALDTTGRIDEIKDVKGSSVKNSIDPSYDYNDNLAGLIDRVDRNNDIDNLVYDGVDRLVSADGKWGTGRYNYDGLGNVLSRSLNNSTINYNYNTLNRLNNLTGAYAYAYQYDTRGNVSNNGRYSLAYNLGQQMTAAKGISYVYDGHDRRVKQTKADGNHYTIYSQGKQLLYREAADGSETDSVYLGKQLVAELESLSTPTQGSAPTVVLSVGATFGSSCPPKTVCLEVVGSPQHSVTWSSTNATSCSGVVNKSLINGLHTGSDLISGTGGSRNYYADGTVYQITLTCTGSGGQTTKQATASGTGGGAEM